MEKAAKQLGYDFSGVDAPKNDKDVYALRYSDFVVPLVKAVQELHSENHTQQEEIASQNSLIQSQQLLLDSQKQKIEALESRFEELEKKLIK